MIGTTMALIGMGIAAAGSAASSAVGAHAAGKAADAQSQAAMYAADQERQSAKDSLDFQKEQYANTQQLEKPYIEAGNVALGQMSSGTQPGGEFNKPYDPSQILKDDPGYQFRMDEAQKALLRSSSATGSLGSGGTLKAITRYGQDYASGELGAAIGRYRSDQDARFNRLGVLSGTGQTANSQVAGAGQQAASNIGNINMTAAHNIGEDVMGAANARASGYIGGANAISSGISGFANNATNLLLLSQLGRRQ